MLLYTPVNLSNKPHIPLGPGFHLISHLRTDKPAFSFHLIEAQCCLIGNINDLLPIEPFRLITERLAPGRQEQRLTVLLQRSVEQPIAVLLRSLEDLASWVNERG